MKYCTIIFITLLLSCVTKNEEVEPNNNPIYVDHSKEIRTKNMSDYFDKCELIPLETNDLSAISRIKRIIFHEEMIFILDRQQNKVLKFNANGKFINVLSGSRGRGPGEFSLITDFSIDKKNNDVYIYSNTPRKIIVYNLNFEFEK